jgi:Ras-related protein Rab-1A
MEEEDIDDINSIEKLEDYDIGHNYLFRICLLGDAGVGKTSILTRFCDNTFKENYNNTIGVDFRLVTLKYKDIISKIHLWDTAGQERFKSLTVNYLHNSHGFLFIYDITNKNSFDNIINWINLSFENNKNSVINFLIGNKCDQNSSRKVEESEAQQFAKDKNLIYLETSAKSDENIQKLFYYCVYKLIKYYDKNDYTEEDNTQLNSSHTEEIKIQRPNQNKCGC